MNLNIMKDRFELFLNERATFYFGEKSALHEAVLYSLLAPGKRIRPLLAVGFCHGFKGREAVAYRCGMAVEMLHTYSLIHDDLPAMDNDDYRRGRPTNHKMYGDAMAILAGDTLLNFSPEFLLKELDAVPLPSSKIVELTSLLLEASGHQGMVKGQSLDMHYEKEDLSRYDKKDLLEILKTIHRLKTGAIINWSCLAGLYSCDDEKIIRHYFDQVRSIGEAIGLLFQMVDDILDVTSDLASLGKTPGKDERAGKLTYTSLYGLKQATTEAQQLIAMIYSNLKSLEETKGDWSLINEIIASLEVKLPR